MKITRNLTRQTISTLDLSEAKSSTLSLPWHNGNINSWLWIADGITVERHYRDGHLVLRINTYPEPIGNNRYSGSVFNTTTGRTTPIRGLMNEPFQLDRSCHYILILTQTIKETDGKTIETQTLILEFTP